MREQSVVSMFVVVQNWMIMREFILTMLSPYLHFNIDIFRFSVQRAQGILMRSRDVLPSVTPSHLYNFSRHAQNGVSNCSFDQVVHAVTDSLHVRCFLLSDFFRDSRCYELTQAICYSDGWPSSMSREADQVYCQWQRWLPVTCRKVPSHLMMIQ